MSPIEFPDTDLLTGQRGSLGLMVWSSLSLSQVDADTLFLTSLTTSPSPLEHDVSFFALNDDDFQPDSIWLESETRPHNQESQKSVLHVEHGPKRFSLTWSRGGAVLGRVVWSEQLFQGDADSCSISGPAFSVSDPHSDVDRVDHAAAGDHAGAGAPPEIPELAGLCGAELIERVVRSIEFARVFAATLPCVLCLDRESIEDALFMAHRESGGAQAMDQLARIARLQASMGLNETACGPVGFIGFIDYVKAAQAARAAWLARR